MSLKVGAVTTLIARVELLLSIFTRLLLMQAAHAALSVITD